MRQYGPPPDSRGNSDRPPDRIACEKVSPDLIASGTTPPSRVSAVRHGTAEAIGTGPRTTLPRAGFAGRHCLGHRSMSPRMKYMLARIVMMSGTYTPRSSQGRIDTLEKLAERIFTRNGPRSPLLTT